MFGFSLTTSSFVGAVLAVAGVPVAEEDLVDTLSVTALELAVGTDGLVGVEDGAIRHCKHPYNLGTAADQMSLLHQ